MTTEMWVMFTLFLIIPSLIAIVAIILSLIRIRHWVDLADDIGNAAIRKFNKFLDD